jgi:hypothetical protein
MAIFKTDLDAFIFITILCIFVIIVNKILSSLFSRIERVSNEQKNKILYAFRVISIIIVAYYLLEGFPSFKQINPEYEAIITGLVSTGLAFATSETFANLMAGLLIVIVDPFEVNDVVKIKNVKGVIKSIKLTRIVLETFDHVVVEIYNKEVVSSIIANYTIKLHYIKNYNQFKKEVFTPQDIGKAGLNFDIIEQDQKVDVEMIALYRKITGEGLKYVHAYTFIMRYPYEKFRIKAYETELLCEKYQVIFGFKPRFHIVNFGFEISVKFRIVCLDPYQLLNNQRLFAKEIYNLVMK